ncbi:MAG: hypothetical protein ACYTFK_13510 [Planctomycetota bacterium]
MAGARVDADADIVAVNSSLIEKTTQLNSELPNEQKIDIQTSLTGRDYDSAFPILHRRALRFSDG